MKITKKTSNNPNETSIISDSQREKGNLVDSRCPSNKKITVFIKIDNNKIHLLKK